MKHNDTQLGVPETIFKATKAAIEAAYTTPGMIAYATDTGEYGYRGASAWIWGSGGGGGMVFGADVQAVSSASAAGTSASAAHSDHIHNLVITDFMPFGTNIQPVTSASAAGTSASAARSDHAHYGDHGALAGLVDNDHPQYLLQALATSTGHYTGFPTKTSVTDPTALSWVDGALGATRTLTLGGTNFKIYIDGLEYTIAGNMTKQIPDTTGMYWFWIELVTGTPTLQAQVGAPGFDKCLVATVYWNTTIDKGILSDERHWMGRDRMMHEYLHETVGARWYTGGTLSFPSANTFALTQCEMYDEDIEHILAAATTCKILYKNGSAAWEWDTGQTYLAKVNGATIRYNNGNALADVSNSNHAAMWLFATNNMSEPFVAIIGQRQDVTIANARANNTPDSLSYGTLPAAEMKLLYRVIFKQGTIAPIEVADYRSVSNIPVSNYTATDHSTLSNLAFATAGHTGFQAEFTAEAANTVYAGPTSGSAAAPTFRAVTAADLSTSGSASSSTYLRGDMSWQTPAGGTSIPIVTSDPASPASGEMWILQTDAGGYRGLLGLGLADKTAYTLKLYDGTNKYWMPFTGP